MVATATPTQERIQIIDVLRGIAIFGILMVNMQYFSNINGSHAPGLELTTLDALGKWTVNAFFVNKFFSLFSFLFGLGVSIQMSRAEQKGVSFLPLYLRRLGLLLLFGLAHAFLFWIGDILFIYAVLGFLLVLFWRKAKPKTLLIWFFVLMGIMTAFFLLSAGSLTLGYSSPESAAMLQGISAENVAAFDADYARDVVIYGSGTYGEVTLERLSDFFVFVLTSYIWLTPSILMMFLMGLYAGKTGWFTTIDTSAFKRRLTYLLPIGLITNITWAVLGFDLGTGSATLDPLFLVGMALLVVGAPALTLSYISIIVLVFESEPGRKILQPLASVGRMALTNYLAHSIVFTTLFYGYGFGLLGQVSFSAGLGLGLVMYLIQIPLSVWWMRTYRFGPFEWLWRSLTYLRTQPMRISQ